jgi:hypothetical protein
MNRGGRAELSSYEDYTRKSGNYDKTKAPVIEIGLPPGSHNVRRSPRHLKR